MPNEETTTAAELAELEVQRGQFNEQVQSAQTAADEARDYLLAAGGSKAATERASRCTANLSALTEAAAELDKRIEAKRGKLTALQAEARDAAKFDNLCAQMKVRSAMKAEELTLWQQANDAAFAALQKLREHQQKEAQVLAEVQGAFDTIVPNVVRKQIYAAPDDKAQEAARALLDKLKSAGVELSALSRDDDRYWLSRQKQVPRADYSYQELPMYFFLQEALDTLDGPALRAHGDAHSAAAARLNSGGDPRETR